MSFCVYCGAALVDPAHCGVCGAHKGGADWQPAPTGVVAGSAIDEGWRPDPTGRHEGRYFVHGQPTDLIRDGGVEGLDGVGKQQLDQAAAVDFSPAVPMQGGSRRWWWVAAAVVGVLALIGAGVGLTLFLTRDRQTVDDKYLADLRKSGLSGEFHSDANAVAHGRQVCRQLEDGGAQQGLPVDQVAVGYYCPKFAQGFHVLESITVKGSFTLHDDSPSAYSTAIAVSDSSCSGSGGYGDIEQGTQVTVKNGKGDILATTTLGAGQGGRYLCTFPFSFRITEGEDRYVVSVSRRGDMSYSFADLKANGVSLELK
jgi:hypothetical protein